MHRILTATLVALCATASAAHAQSKLTINDPLRPIEPYPVLSNRYDLSVNEVVSVVDTSAEFRLATLRLVGGAVVTVGFWYPAVPFLSGRPYLHPVPAAMMTRALRSVQNNPSRYQRPFTLKVWWDMRYNTVGNYSAYSGTELQLFVPSPSHYTGSGNSGGLAEVKIAAAGNLLVGAYPTWGYLVLEDDEFVRRSFHFLSTAQPQLMLSPIDGPRAESLCDKVFVSPLWVGLVTVHRDGMNRFIHSGTGWWN